MKTVSFRKPATPATAEQWVKGSGDRETSAPTPAEPMKRFTIDVPIELHRRIKAGCAERGLKMADALRELLEREFPRT
jgi:hypothetical protein